MAGLGIALGEHELVVGLGRVGDPVLLAVQQVGAVGLADRGGQHRRNVGSGRRLGQAEAAQLLALRQRHEVALLLLLAAVPQQREGVQADVHRDQRAEGRLAPLDLLADQRLAHVVEAGAAVLGRDRRAQDAQLGHALDDPHVEVVVDVVVLGDRHHPPVDELTDGLLDRPLVVGQLKVHTAPRRRGCSASDPNRAPCQMWTVRWSLGSSAHGGKRGLPVLTASQQRWASPPAIVICGGGLSPRAAPTETPPNPGGRGASRAHLAQHRDP